MIRLLMFFAVLMLILVHTHISAGNESGDVAAKRGIIAFDAGQYEPAVEELQTALTRGVKEFSPEEIYTLLGDSYNELGQHDKAISTYQEAIRLNSDYYNAWVGLGISHRLTGDLDEAEKSYKKALAIKPDYAEAHLSLGVLYILKQDAAKAEQAFKKAIEINPELAAAYGNLAMAYAMQGKFDDADAALRQAAVLGYENLADMQERIANLRSLQQGK